MSYARVLVGVLVVVMVSAGTLLPGCAVTGGGPPTLDRFKPLFRMGVSIAVDRLLMAQPELVPLTVQVSTVLVDAVNSEEFTSIAEVSAFIRARVPWDKIGADVRPLVEALIVGIGEELRVIAEQHDIPQTQAIVLVREVLTWIGEAAKRHVVAPVYVPQVRRAS